MSDSSSQLAEMYEVIINQDEQYSIWPANKAVPQGWQKVGRQGSKKFCLEFVREAWVDMRPLSLRTQMESS